MANKIIVVPDSSSVIVTPSSNKSITVSKSNSSNPVVISKGTVVTVSTGDTSALRSSFIAGEAIQAYDLVAAFNSVVYKASVFNIDHAENVIGIATSSAATGEAVQVTTAGNITFSGWTWIDSQALFAGGTPGSIVQNDLEVIDGAVFSVMVGRVRDPDTVYVNIQTPILY